MQQQELMAHHSVKELHQWIEEVFTGRAGSPSALEQLLGSFSPSFSMVTITGQTIGLAEVEALFRNHAGGRPGLQITIDACETLLLTENSVVCRYRETHRNADEVLSRWSVAIIDIVANKPLWRYLHETAIAG